jgi:PKD repeat protein
MEQCFSGGFIDNFINNYAGTQRRVIATASTGSEPSWGNGFSNAWTSGMARIDEARLPNFRADITPIDGRISMWEAYNYSVYYDPAALPSLPNHEHPQYNAKNSATLGTTQYLSSCPVQTTPTIKVTTPNAAESWKKGSTYFITWTQTGLTQSNVNISLWKGTSRQQYIAEVPASSSRYFWLVPTTLATATDYRINISSVGTTPTVFDRSDTDFGIVPATGPGYLWVNTTPVQLATIYIDGVVTGTTNTKLTLPNGEHNVTVTKADYYSMQSTANVKTDQTSAAIFVLERINEADFYPYGSIVIDSEPHGAEVVIDEDSTGLTTPASTEIMNGNHAVYVIADGYETPTTKTVYVPEHGTVNLEFTLTRSPSVLPLPGYTNPPTDPDGDGLYEDLNCNGFADWDDAVVLFWNTDWIQEHEPVTAFDFNHNGFIDWDDAVVLFWKV